MTTIFQKRKADFLLLMSALRDVKASVNLDDVLNPPEEEEKHDVMPEAEEQKTDIVEMNEPGGDDGRMEEGVVDESTFMADYNRPHTMGMDLRASGYRDDSGDVGITPSASANVFTNNEAMDGDIKVDEQLDAGEVIE